MPCCLGMEPSPGSPHLTSVRWCEQQNHFVFSRIGCSVTLIDFLSTCWCTCCFYETCLKWLKWCATPPMFMSLAEQSLICSEHLSAEPGSCTNSFSLATPSGFLEKRGRGSSCGRCMCSPASTELCTTRHRSDHSLQGPTA